MKRFINSAIPLFALFLASPGQGQQPQRSVSDVVKATVESVVLIVINDESGKPIAEGSGFIASSDGKIVTNHHVIAGLILRGSSLTMEHSLPLTESSLTILTTTLP
jgi:S1-C subfamily serine protease